MNINLIRYGQGIPIVFFHGWGFDSTIWMPLVPQLKDSYQLILVDLPGFGTTPMMDWADFKNELLQLLPDQFALVGWSMGGLFATRLAIEGSDRVSSLLNITTSPRFIMDSQWPGASKELFIKFHKNLSLDLNATLAEFIGLQLQKTKVEFIPGNQPSVLGLESGLKILESWDLREELKSLSMPVYYMFGRLDPITSVKTMEIMESIYPQFKYKLFKSAHMLFLSQQEEFVAEVKGFLK